MDHTADLSAKVGPGAVTASLGFRKIPARNELLWLHQISWILAAEQMGDHLSAFENVCFCSRQTLASAAPSGRAITSITDLL